MGVKLHVWTRERTERAITIAYLQSHHLVNIPFIVQKAIQIWWATDQITQNNPAVSLYISSITMSCYLISVSQYLNPGKEEYLSTGRK